MAFRRITISLPSELLDDLDAIAAGMSVSRSAAITELLSRNVETMRFLASQLPLDLDAGSPVGSVGEADVKRLRGASVEYIRTQFDKAFGSEGGDSNG